MFKHIFIEPIIWSKNMYKKSSFKVHLYSLEILLTEFG